VPNKSVSRNLLHKEAPPSAQRKNKNYPRIYSLSIEFPCFPLHLKIGGFLCVEKQGQRFYLSNLL